MIEGAPAVSFVQIYKALFSHLWFIQVWVQRDTPGKEGRRLWAESKGGISGPQTTYLRFDDLSWDLCRCS